MKTIVLYSKKDCQPCKATKRKLEEKKLNYTDIDVEEMPEKVEYLKSKGVSQLPHIEVYWGKQIMNRWSGYKPDLLNKL